MADKKKGKLPKASHQTISAKAPNRGPGDGQTTERTNNKIKKHVLCQNNKQANAKGYVEKLTSKMVRTIYKLKIKGEED